MQITQLALCTTSGCALLLGSTLCLQTFPWVQKCQVKDVPNYSAVGGSTWTPTNLQHQTLVEFVELAEMLANCKGHILGEDRYTTWTCFGFTATLGLALVAAEHPTSGNHRIFCHNWIKQKLLVHTFSILEMMADSIHSQTCQTELHPIPCRPRSWEAWYSGMATCWDEYHIRCQPDFSTLIFQQVYIKQQSACLEMQSKLL